MPSVKINGKLCQLPDGATVAELRRQNPSDVRGDQVVRQEGHSSHALGETEPLKDDDKLFSIPKIVKGSDSARFDAEVSLLRNAAGSGRNVKVGVKTMGSTEFRVVLLTKVAVPRQKFDVTSTDLLFLVPPQYPALPPIGCYLNYKWNTTDKHFILRGHHGAPSLDSEGWYWYCVGLGGGLGGRSLGRTWQPGTRADNGHNLVTLFAAAVHAIINDDE